ncbi:hypothetical protein HZA56_05880 [Candidatus Poribacteria bacterium]|nr:hypothetical protein [Candidatus Poribacteria bacterium]
MDLISRTVVERIARNLATQPTRHMSVEAERFNREQPLLASFISAFSSQLPPAAQDLTLYLAYMLWRIFEDSGATVRPVSADTILEQIQQNWLFIERFVQMARNATGGCLTEIDFLSQPHMLEYLTNTIFEEGGRSNIAEKHMGYMFFILKTVLDSLDAAAVTKRKESGKHP